MNTMGNRIAEFRKKKGLTQDQLAEQLGISAQAVSKWETDASCPDIGLIPQLSKILGISLNELFGMEPEQSIILVPESERKKPEQLLFKVIVDSADGDKVRVNLPFILIKALSGHTDKLPIQMGDLNLSELIDIDQLIAMAEAGLLGQFVEVDSADGDHIHVFVE